MPGGKFVTNDRISFDTPLNERVLQKKILLKKWNSCTVYAEATYSSRLISSFLVHQANNSTISWLGVVEFVGLM